MEIIQKIMLFINQHTLLLIGICVFLILVLIGYLINNSVKSKRVRKDIKNPDQVPENIKDEIIKQAEEKNIIKENTNNVVMDNTNIQNQDNVQTSSVNINEENNNVNVNNINDTNNINSDVDVNASNENIDIPQEMNVSLDLDSTNTQLNGELITPIQNNINNELQSNVDTFNPFSIDMNEQNTPILNDLSKDPDAYLMNQKQNTQYENDKSLSEILSNINSYSNIQNETNINQPNIDIPVINNENISNQNSFEEMPNIFSDNQSNIVINNNVSKNDVQIENSNSSDELDRIMRKLSSTSNNEDDNYTNIF